MVNTTERPSHWTERLDVGRLLQVLAVIGLFELLIYRLAGPVLRPAGDATPALGHEILENVGLFGFHLTAVLAPMVLLLAVLQRPRDRARDMGDWAALLAASLVVALGLVAQIMSPAPSTVELALNIAYGLTLVIVIASALARPGDLGIRFGLIVIATPLLIHAAGPLLLRIRGPEALYTGLPETITSIGHWALILAASAAPYCFGPRPLFRSMARPAPIFVGAFVGIVAAVIVRKHFEVGAVLASYGLGVELGPGVPQPVVALALLGLGAMSWTLVSCFLAPSAARRRVGLGIALILLAGYGFNWPMQYSLGALGMVVIARAARRAAEQEQEQLVGAAIFRGPPIEPDTWAAYVAELALALEQQEHVEAVDAMTSTSEGDTRTSLRICYPRFESLLSVSFVHSSIESIDICIGEQGSGQPSWSLEALGDGWGRGSHARRRLGGHPPPPSVEAPVTEVGEPAFDRRFQVRDAGGYTADIVGDEHQRIMALLDGWIVVWPGTGLQFRVCPGRGAPLDHPIPITELAFRGDSAPPSVDRMLALLDVLHGIAERVLELRGSAV